MQKIGCDVHILQLSDLWQHASQSTSWMQKMLAGYSQLFHIATDGVQNKGCVPSSSALDASTTLFWKRKFSACCWKLHIKIIYFSRDIAADSHLGVVSFDSHREIKKSCEGRKMYPYMQIGRLTAWLEQWPVLLLL